MFKSIVVAYDGSAHASKALEIGTTLAAAEQAALGIIYVVDVNHMNLPVEIREMGEVEHIIEPMPHLLVNFENAPASLANSLAQSSADSQRAMIQYADFLVGEARQAAEKQGVTDIEATALPGDPADEVLEFARERKADLIICGSRGLGKMQKLLIGSTSEKISRHAECSCLVVR